LAGKVSIAAANPTSRSSALGTLATATFPSAPAAWPAAACFLRLFTRSPVLWPVPGPRLPCIARRQQTCRTLPPRELCSKNTRFGRPSLGEPANHPPVKAMRAVCVGAVGGGRSFSYWERPPMNRLLRKAFSRLVKTGAITVLDAGGCSHAYGDGTGTPVTIRFMSAAWEFAVVLDPELRLGEAYMEGGLVVEEGSIADFLDIIVKNTTRGPPSAWVRGLNNLRSLMRR